MVQRQEAEQNVKEKLMETTHHPETPVETAEQVTPEWLFLSRRKFMAAAGATAGALALAACAMPGATSAPAAGPTATPGPNTTALLTEAIGELPAVLGHAEPFASAATDELADPLNDFTQITNYNNYYEFSYDKEEVNPLSRNFSVYPWRVNVEGMVNNPGVHAIEDLIRDFPQEERIYRLRCVEAWSMVIPWVGFTLSSLLNAVEPTAEAKYVKFTSVLRPEEMPGQRTRSLNWPYVEGLRLDEAMHPLTILATGMYGKLLTPANGAPLRLIVPWKYGFKGIKGIVNIELTDQQPVSTWEQAASNEYGFYANVNPSVSHPRWSQATERRIGEGGRRETLPFNGYGDQVAHLYEGMDLAENY